VGWVGQTKADILRGGWVGSDMGCRSKVPPVQRNGTLGRQGPGRRAHALALPVSRTAPAARVLVLVLVLVLLLVVVGSLFPERIGGAAAQARGVLAHASLRRTGGVVKWSRQRHRPT
jgi:hypothetical protein